MTESLSSVDQVRQEGRGAVLGEFAREFGRVRVRGWGNPWGYILGLPPLLLYATFSAYPILRGLVMAFQDYRFLIPETRSPLVSFNGLGNWVEMFRDPFFWQSLKVSVIFTLGEFPLSLVLGLFCAVVISSLKTGFMPAVTRVVTYLPVVLPMAVAMKAWSFLYSQDLGYINYLIEKLFGVPEGPIWLGYDWAIFSVIIASAWKSFGFNTLLFLVGIYGINQELYEAASIDGAGAWDRFWHITLPSLKPIFTLIFVLGAGILSATEQMMLLTDGGPADSTLSTGLYIWRVAFSFGDMRLGYASAMSLLLGLVHTVLAAIIFKTLGTERA